MLYNHTFVKSSIYSCSNIINFENHKNLFGNVCKPNCNSCLEGCKAEPWIACNFILSGIFYIKSIKTLFFRITTDTSALFSLGYTIRKKTFKFEIPFSYRSKPHKERCCLSVNLLPLWLWILHLIHTSCHHFIKYCHSVLLTVL